MKILTSEYNIKREAIREYEEAIKFKKMYEELCESFQSIVQDLFEYANKHHIDLPNRERIYRNIEKARQLIEYRISQTEYHSQMNTQNETRKDGTE